MHDKNIRIKKEKEKERRRRRKEKEIVLFIHRLSVTEPLFFVKFGTII